MKPWCFGPCFQPMPETTETRIMRYAIYEINNPQSYCSENRDHQASPRSLPRASKAYSPHLEYQVIPLPAPQQTTCRESEVSYLAEELEDQSITAPDSVDPSGSLSSKPERYRRLLNYCPSVTADQFSEDAGDVLDLDRFDSISDGIDEELCFNTQYPDVYFSTGINI